MGRIAAWKGPCSAAAWHDDAPSDSGEKWDYVGTHLSDLLGHRRAQTAWHSQQGKFQRSTVITITGHVQNDTLT